MGITAHIRMQGVIDNAQEDEPVAVEKMYNGKYMLLFALLGRPPVRCRFCSVYYCVHTCRE